MQDVADISIEEMKDFSAQIPLIKEKKEEKLSLDQCKEVLTFYTSPITRWNKLRFIFTDNFREWSPEVKNFAVATQLFEFYDPGFSKLLLEKINEQDANINTVFSLFYERFLKIQNDYKASLELASNKIIGDIFDKTGISKYKCKEDFIDLCKYYEKVLLENDYKFPKPKLRFCLDEKTKYDLNYHAKIWVLIKQNFGENLKKLKKSLVLLQEENEENLKFKKMDDPVWYDELQEDSSFTLPNSDKIKKRHEKAEALKTSKKIALFNGFSNASMGVFGLVALFGTMIPLSYLILICICLFIPSFFAFYFFTQKDIFSVLKNFRFSNVIDFITSKQINFFKKSAIVILTLAFTLAVASQCFVGMHGFLALFVGTGWILSLGPIAFAISAGIMMGIFATKFVYDFVVNFEKYMADFSVFLADCYWKPIKIVVKEGTFSERCGLIPHLIFNLIKHSLGVLIFVIAALLGFECTSPCTHQFLGWFFKPGASLFLPDLISFRIISTATAGLNAGYWAMFGISKIRILTNDLTLRSVLGAFCKLPFFLVEFPFRPIIALFSIICGKPVPKPFFSKVYQIIDQFMKKHIQGKTFSNTDGNLIEYTMTELSNLKLNSSGQEKNEMHDLFYIKRKLEDSAKKGCAITMAFGGGLAMGVGGSAHGVLSKIGIPAGPLSNSVKTVILTSSNVGNMLNPTVVRQDVGLPNSQDQAVEETVLQQ